MQRDVTENLLALGGLSTQLEELVRQSDDPAQQVLLLAQTLRSLWPSAPLTVCALPCAGDQSVVVLDAAGESRPRWADLLRGALETEGPLPAALELQGWTLARAPLATPDGGRGTLGLALREDDAAEQAAGRALLALVAQQMVLRLALEAQERKLQLLEKEVEIQTTLANLGELARPVTHEFNNFLNVLLLHMAVLDMELPAKSRQEVAEIQRQGKAITAVVRQFQRYRHNQHAQGEVVQLNELVRAAVASLTPGPCVDLKLAPDLPQVTGNLADFRRLCHFLLANAVAVVSPHHGSITLHTEKATGKARLRLEDNGPSVSEDLLHHLFDLNVTVREGTCALELAACKSLVRRLQGSIQAENRAEGGLRIILEFPAAVS